MKRWGDIFPEKLCFQSAASREIELHQIKTRETSSSIYSSTNFVFILYRRSEGVLERQKRILKLFFRSY